MPAACPPTASGRSAGRPPATVSAVRSAAASPRGIELQAPARTPCRGCIGVGLIERPRTRLLHHVRQLMMQNVLPLIVAQTHPGTKEDVASGGDRPRGERAGDSVCLRSLVYPHMAQIVPHRGFRLRTPGRRQTSAIGGDLARLQRRVLRKWNRAASKPSASGKLPARKIRCGSGCLSVGPGRRERAPG